MVSAIAGFHGSYVQRTAGPVVIWSAFPEHPAACVPDGGDWASAFFGGRMGVIGIPLIPWAFAVALPPNYPHFAQAGGECCAEMDGAVIVHKTTS